ncbi:probable WRKY transcription factor 27 [Tanacetum coccineum]
MFQDFCYSDTTHLSRSVKVLKLKNFKKDATLKLFKNDAQDHNVKYKFKEQAQSKKSMITTTYSQEKVKSFVKWMMVQWDCAKSGESCTTGECRGFDSGSFVNMDDGAWDLQAVVRSCTTGTAADVTAAVNATTVEDYDDGSYNLEVLASGNEDNTFLYQSTFGKSFSGGLEDVYKGGTSITDVLRLNISSFSLHAMESQSARPRKRKNQEKTVFQLTQEDLSNDLWAWRKYGQKPIRGSPFPRNYYRCSTTKACGAKKQVKRSPVDSNIFIVSYSGEHIHPRPMHRSSLARSIEKDNKIKYRKTAKYTTTLHAAFLQPMLSTTLLARLLLQLPRQVFLLRPLLRRMNVK